MWGPNPVPAERPLTAYAAALLYLNAAGDRMTLGVRYVNVSGVNPLTDEEAIARARKIREAEKDWATAECRVFKMGAVSMTILQ